MSTRNPRINVAMEKALYEVVQGLAKKDGVSMSLKVRDLVREGLEVEEDIALAAFVKERENTFKRNKALKHDEVW